MASTPPSNDTKSAAHDRKPPTWAFVFEGVVGAVMALASLIGFGLTMKEELLQVSSIGQALVVVLHLIGWLGLIMVGFAMMTRHTRILGGS
jgi:hypothetical protein